MFTCQAIANKWDKRFVVHCRQELNLQQNKKKKIIITTYGWKHVRIGPFTHLNPSFTHRIFFDLSLFSCNCTSFSPHWKILVWFGEKLLIKSWQQLLAHWPICHNTHHQIPLYQVFFGNYLLLAWFGRMLTFDTFHHFVVVVEVPFELDQPNLTKKKEKEVSSGKLLNDQIIHDPPCLYL